MDDLDLSIYRWMYPDGVWSYWGIDPRITTAEIAQHLGLRRKAVWARIRQWRQSGLWQDPTVRPNPRLFGLNQFQAELPVADAAQGWALVEELGLVGRVLVSNVAFTTTETGKPSAAANVLFVVGHCYLVVGDYLKTGTAEQASAVPMEGGPAVNPAAAGPPHVWAG